MSDAKKMLKELAYTHLVPNDEQGSELVAVVRCKECIGKAHWYKNDYGCTICGLSGVFVVEDNDYCSYGERKDDENT